MHPCSYPHHSVLQCYCNSLQIYHCGGSWWYMITWTRKLVGRPRTVPSQKDRIACNSLMVCHSSTGRSLNCGTNQIFYLLVWFSALFCKYLLLELYSVSSILKQFSQYRKACWILRAPWYWCPSSKGWVCLWLHVSINHTTQYTFNIFPCKSAYA